MQEVSFLEPLYRAQVCIVSDCSLAEFRASVPSVTYYSWDEAFTGLEDGTDGYQFHVQEPDEVFYVWMETADPYMLGHELHHLAHDILFTRGIGYCSASEEAFAYLTGRLHELYTKGLSEALPANKPNVDEGGRSSPFLRLGGDNLIHDPRQKVKLNLHVNENNSL